MASQERVKGKVRWFNDAKGFGFIAPEDGTADLFVHQSSIKSDGYRTLAEGEVVEFSVAEGDDGRTKAADVTGPEGGNVQGGGGSSRSDGGNRGGSRGGYGFNGGYRGGGGCFKCGGVGHMARDCNQGGGGGGGYGNSGC